MDLSTLDTIRDNGINNGIGGSGLVSQSIERANIEDLRSLRSAVAESQATLQNQDEQRKASLLPHYLNNQQSIISGAGASGRGDNAAPLNPNAPVAFITQDPNHEGVFGLNYRRGTGDVLSDTVNKTLNTSDLEDFVKQNPNIQLVLPGGLNMDAATKTRLDALGVKNVSISTGKQLAAAQERPVSGTEFLLKSVGTQVDKPGTETPNQKQLKNLSSNPAKFNIKELESNTSAKMISNYYDRLAHSAKQGQNLDLYNSFKAALNTGNARGLMEAIIKDGGWNG